MLAKLRELALLICQKCQRQFTVDAFQSNQHVCINDKKYIETRRKYFELPKRDLFDESMIQEASKIKQLEEQLQKQQIINNKLQCELRLAKTKIESLQERLCDKNNVNVTVTANNYSCFGFGFG